MIEVFETEDRYHRQSLITWWDQERLAASRMLVVGAGALGNEIVKNLALLGVGSIVIVDLDEIEPSNLARCVMFRTEDEGRAKAPLLAGRAMELNPDVHAVGIHGDVRHSLGLGAFMDADVVLGALDNREARLFVNAACWRTTTPWVDGAIEGLMGVMRVFVPPHSADYESTLSDEEQALLARRRACTLLSEEDMQSGKVPTTATSASVIAGMQAQEAVKLLHADRIPSDFAGKGFMFNGITHDSYVVTYTARDDVMSRDTYDLEDVEPVTATTTFAEMLERASAELGRDAHLELEREVLHALRCSTCDTRESVDLPITAVRRGAAICPGCGGERRLELVHRITEGSDLLDQTPRDVGLPGGDVVAMVNGAARRFLLVDPDASPFRGHV